MSDYNWHILLDTVFYYWILRNKNDLNLNLELCLTKITSTTENNVKQYFLSICNNLKYFLRQIIIQRK